MGPGVLATVHCILILPGRLGLRFANRGKPLMWVICYAGGRDRQVDAADGINAHSATSCQALQGLIARFLQMLVRGYRPPTQLAYCPVTPSHEGV